MLPHAALAEPVRPLHRLLAGASSSPRHRLREGPDGGSEAGVEAGGGHHTVGYRGRGGRNLKLRSCSVRFFVLATPSSLLLEEETTTRRGGEGRSRRGSRRPARDGGRGLRARGGDARAKESGWRQGLRARGGNHGRRNRDGGGESRDGRTGRCGRLH